MELNSVVPRCPGSFSRNKRHCQRMGPSVTERRLSQSTAQGGARAAPGRARGPSSWGLGTQLSRRYWWKQPAPEDGPATGPPQDSGFGPGRWWLASLEEVTSSFEAGPPDVTRVQGCAAWTPRVAALPLQEAQKRAAAPRPGSGQKMDACRDNTDTGLSAAASFPRGLAASTRPSQRVDGGWTAAQRAAAGQLGEGMFGGVSSEAGLCLL